MTHVIARSAPNIAFIKYWGNRNDALRLPAADSLSMTLDGPGVEITLEAADTVGQEYSCPTVSSVRSYQLDGSEKLLTPKDIARFENTLSLMRTYLGTIDIQDELPTGLSLTIRSAIPPSVGLASSAAVFSCLSKAVSAFIRGKIELTTQQESVLARLGSGSAARSIEGGFVALNAGSGDAIDASAALQIADEDHWPLHDIVVIPAMEEKKVGSSEGHFLASTSPFFKERIRMITERRQQECTDAILQRDFEKLRRVTEEDCLDMHRVMETSTPPLRYLTEETHRIVNAIKELRTTHHLPVLFTMDAGPTVHLVCEEEARATVVAFANAQKGCRVFETKVGRGAMDNFPQ